MDDTIVIGGIVSLKHTVGGSCKLKSIVNGQGGIYMPVYPDMYSGELIITPKAHEEQTLECAHKTMPDNVTVLKVPYYETSNDDGTTVYIASGGVITNG